ncbi:MAG: lysostaphin resistance A-like protein [Planctomycetota bacterium]|jgi:membrane protease YdiL (CAAX protease family)
MKEDYPLQRWAWALLNFTVSYFLFSVAPRVELGTAEKFEIKEKSLKTFADLQNIPAVLGSREFTVNLLNPMFIAATAAAVCIFVIFWNFVSDKNNAVSGIFEKKHVCWFVTAIINITSVTFYLTFWLLVLGAFCFFRDTGIPLWFYQFAFILAELLAVVFIIYKADKRNRLLRGLGLWGRGLQRKVAAGITYFCCALPFFVIILFTSAWAVDYLRKLTGIEKGPDMQQLVIVSLLDNTFFLVLTAVLAFTVVPLVEEFFFRGMIYGSLRKYLSPIVSAIVCGLLFGLVHEGAEKFIPISFLGFILCRIREKTGSLYPAIAVHGIYNAVIILIMVSMFL